VCVRECVCVSVCVCVCAIVGRGLRNLVSVLVLLSETGLHNSDIIATIATLMPSFRGE